MYTSERKRVAIVVRPAAGGIRRHVTLLCSRLVEKYEVILFAPSDFTLDRPVANITQIALPISAKNRPLYDWRMIRQLSRLLREHRCDFVHAHGIRAALIGVLAAKRAGIPAFFTAHNLVLELSRIEQTVLKLLGSKTRRIIAVSAAVKTTLTQCGISAEKISVVPNGIDLAEIDANIPLEPLPFQGKIVAAIGRLSSEKGLEFLLKAFEFSAFDRSDVHLLIAGTGQKEKALVSLASQLSNAAQVHFLGYVEKTAQVYRAADIVVIPSLQEGQGIVALEAMAYRKPVIASDIGGLSETVIHGETGVLVEAKNVVALSTALLQLIKSVDLCQKMGEAGRKRVEQEYTVEKMVERIEAIYEGRR